MNQNVIVNPGGRLNVPLRKHLTGSKVYETQPRREIS